MGCSAKSRIYLKTTATRHVVSRKGAKISIISVRRVSQGAAKQVEEEFLVYDGKPDQTKQKVAQIGVKNDYNAAFVMKS